MTAIFTSLLVHYALICFITSVQGVYVQKNHNSSEVIKEKLILFEFSAEELDVKFCRDSSDCGYDINEFCLEGICQCVPYHKKSEAGKCELCPEEGEKCTNCCFGPMLTCYRDTCVKCRIDSRTGVCISQEALFYMTLTQVFLATAMIFGIIALITILYRLCTQPIYMSRRHRRSPAAQESFNRSLFSRASLSSLQRRVIFRLRDRPPCYQRNVPTNTAPVNTPVNSGPNSPPPYDEVGGVEYTGEDLPPAYSISVISSPAFDVIVTNDNISNINSQIIPVDSQCESSLKIDPTPASQTHVKIEES